MAEFQRLARVEVISVAVAPVTWAAEEASTAAMWVVGAALIMAATWVVVTSVAVAMSAAVAAATSVAVVPQVRRQVRAIRKLNW
jgi:hypothetical protein